MSPELPELVVLHARSGVVALNVVTAALQADARTADVPVTFAPDRGTLARELRRAAEQGRRPVAGWSFYSPDFAQAAQDLAWVRAQTADLDVLHVAGGVHATAEPLQTLRAGFDLCALGEGEATVVALFAALQEGRDPRGRARAGAERTLDGLAYLDGDQLVSRGPGARHPLDQYPAFNARAGKWNAIEITRGCVYACAFCQTPFMFKARFRHRSVENVRAHVRQLREGGARYVRFLTPTCLSYGTQGEEPDLAAVEALLAACREELPDGKIYFGTFPSELRPEHVTPAALALLKRYVDNDHLVIGGQSGSERVLQQTRRGHTVADVERAVRLSLEAGFVPDVDFLLGLPGEEPEDQALSLQLARKLVGLGARIHSHAFMPLPGTPLRGAVPSELDAQVVAGLEQLEGAGKSYGQWRKQQAVAEQLVQLRRG